MEKEHKLSDSSSESMLKKISSILRAHAAPVCLFILLPIIVAGYLGINAVQIEQQKHLEQNLQKLDTYNTQLTCEFDQETFLKKVSRGAWKGFLRYGNSSEFVQFYDSLKRFLPIDYDLYAFDSSGKLVTPPQFNLKSRYLATRLWELVTAGPGEQIQKFQKIKRSLKSFLGDEFRVVHLVDGRDTCLPLILKHSRGYLYWINDPEEPAKGILMIFWDSPDEEFRIRQITSRENFKEFSGFFSRAGEEFGFLNGKIIDNAIAEKLFIRIATMDQRVIPDDRQNFWTGRKLDGVWFFSFIQIDNNFFQSAKNLLLGSMILLILSGLAIYLYINRNDRMFVSIRLKLLALFLIAVTTPIMGFVYMGYRYLDDREQNLRSEVANQGRQKLFELEESFKDAGKSYTEEFSQLSHGLMDLNEKFKAQIFDKIEDNDLISIELRDAANADIVFFDQNELFFEGMREVTDAFSRFCIDSMLGSSLVDSVDPMLQTITRSPEAGLSFFFNRPGEVHKMEFGSVPYFLFWEILESKDGRQFYSYAVRSAVRLLQGYIRNILVSAKRQNLHAPFILVAGNQKTDEWFPARVKESSEFKQFSSRAYFSDKPLEAVINIDESQYLVIAQKGKIAVDYALFSFYPMSIIKADITYQRRLITIAIALFVIIAFLLGWLLSDTFILPVSRLGEGVQAIKARNHAFRIEPQQQDEFGDLAISFNHMIADLKEMQLAKDVQESLLPAAPPELPGYAVSFSNRMASAVGGDYFEVTRISPEKFCVIVGDVTGHGVGSALVMAMAKALFYQGLKEGRDLVTLFSDVNFAIYEYFHKPPVRKMITVFACLINIESGEGEFVNAGHNYPVKVSAGGVCEDLAAVHLPIGATKNLRKLATKKFEIGHQETIIFYTDGLIEVADKKSEQYGYERFKEVLGNNPGLAVNALADKLLEEYDQWLNGGEPDDDLTLIVLRRL